MATIILDEYELATVRCALLRDEQWWRKCQNNMVATPEQRATWKTFADNDNALWRKLSEQQRKVHF